MNYIDKIKELRELLKSTLTPLIDSDYVLLDIPYYDNYGDTLIWEGTEIFLKSIPHKCIHKTDIKGYNGQIYHKDVIILLQGGGNFGDLWERYNRFRSMVIKNHPHNKIIILPQTIYYKDKSVQAKDAEFFSNYPNVTICARDTTSYDIIKTNFSNNVLLLPDMAFFIDVSKYSRATSKGKTLFLKRNDIELKSSETPASIPSDADVSDWPSLYKKFDYRLFCKFRRCASIIDKYLYNGSYQLFVDWYWSTILKSFCVKTAVNFIDKYDLVFSTRLHVIIMGVLLGKEVRLIDNSYGKNSSFYNTWLSDVDTLKPIDGE